MSEQDRCSLSKRPEKQCALPGLCKKCAHYLFLCRKREKFWTHILAWAFKWPKSPPFESVSKIKSSDVSKRSCDKESFEKEENIAQPREQLLFGQSRWLKEVLLYFCTKSTLLSRRKKGGGCEMFLGRIYGFEKANLVF